VPRRLAINLGVGVDGGAAPVREGQFASAPKINRRDRTAFLS
jgi:hypothetical protein